MRIRDLAVEERPRERLLAGGVAMLSCGELLAILLGHGTRGENAIQLAGRLISVHGLQRLSQLSAVELSSIRGIGDAKAARLLAAFELHRRIVADNAPARILGVDDAIEYCTPIIGHLMQEHFLVVFLNSKNAILGHEIVTKGLVGESLVHPREVYRGAIQRGASAIIVAHNHPSGSLEASEHDREVTRVLAEAGVLIGIPLLDHLIVAQAGGRAIG